MAPWQGPASKSIIEALEYRLLKFVRKLLKFNISGHWRNNNWMQISNLAVKTRLAALLTI